MRSTFLLTMVLWGGLCLGWSLDHTPLSNLDATNSLHTQIVVSKTKYPRGSTIRLKFLIRNQGSEPFYLFRGLSACSNQIGSLFLLIRDEQGNVVNSEGCSVEVDMYKLDVVEELTNPESGVEIKPREIFAQNTELQLPRKKGTYHIAGKFIPAAFPRAQTSALAGRKIRVPLRVVSAETITVRAQ